MLKKILSVLLVLSFVLCMASCGEKDKETLPLEESEYITSGVDENKITYDEYEDYVIVTGIQGVPDDIEIPEKINNKEVKAIADDAFSDMGWITSIKMPDTIVEIGDNAFYKCVSAEKIRWSDNLYSIGASAFFGNRTIESVRFPSGVKEIGGYAFSECDKLKNVIIPDKTESIGGNAFEGTEWLENKTDEFVIVGNGVLIDYNGNGKKVKIPDGVVEVASFCNDMNVEEVVYSESVKRIGDYAFANTSLKTVTIPDSITIIGKNAFDTCLELEKITFGGNLEVIGDYAFTGCQKLTEINIPENVKKIGQHAFSRCDELKELTLNSAKTEIGENICSDCKDTLKIKCPKKSPATQYAKEQRFILDII